VIPSYAFIFRAQGIIEVKGIQRKLPAGFELPEMGRTRVVDTIFTGKIVYDARMTE
jgi:hypothetical protein